MNGPGGFGVTYGQLLTTANLAPADGYGSIPLQLAKLAPGSKLAGLAFTGIYGSGMNGVLVAPATERIPVSAGTVIGTSNGSVLASANLANTVLAPYGGYASLVKAGALPELLPFADWAKGETAAAAWSLRPQDGVIHFLGGWNQLGYPYDQQPGGC